MDSTFQDIFSLSFFFHWAEIILSYFPSERKSWLSLWTERLFCNACISVFPHTDGSWNELSLQRNIFKAKLLLLPMTWQAICTRQEGAAEGRCGQDQGRCGQDHRAPAAPGCWSSLWGLRDPAQEQSSTTSVWLMADPRCGKIRGICKTASDFPPSMSSFTDSFFIQCKTEVWLELFLWKRGIAAFTI